MIPVELVVNTGEEIAFQDWRQGSWAYVYRYGKWFVSLNEVEGKFHNDAESAFICAGIGQHAYDETMNIIIDSEFENLIKELQ